MSDRPWQELGKCRGLDPDLFFPGRGEVTEDAKAVCAGCPVREPCLQYALDGGEQFGIWGGRSEHERRRLRRSQLRKKTCGYCRTVFWGQGNFLYCGEECSGSAHRQAKQESRRRHA